MEYKNPVGTRDMALPIGVNLRLKCPLKSVAPCIDPPQSPLKRGTKIPVPPFLRGARGDRRFDAYTKPAEVRFFA
jgi:hypothetical protein